MGRKNLEARIRLTASGIGYWQSGNVWSVLANQDHLAGTTTNQALVVGNLNLVFSLWAHYDQFQCVFNPSINIQVADEIQRKGEFCL